MPGPSQLNSIEHVVVLMLENRSFDHMLGFLYADDYKNYIRSRTAAYDAQRRSPGPAEDRPARPGAAEEGDGWVMAYVYDRPSDGSICVILDAREIERAPVAEIVMPRRVPHGFHGNWMPA